MAAGKKQTGMIFTRGHRNINIRKGSSLKRSRKSSLANIKGNIPGYKVKVS